MLLKNFVTLEHTLVCTFNKTSYMFQRFGISCSHFPFTLKLLPFFFLYKFCNFDKSFLFILT